MTKTEMIDLCNEAIAEGVRVSLTVPAGKMPDGFPMGDLLCECGDGRKVYSFNAHKVKAWAEGQR